MSFRGISLSILHDVCLWANKSLWIFTGSIKHLPQKFYHAKRFSLSHGCAKHFITLMLQKCWTMILFHEMTRLKTFCGSSQEMSQRPSRCQTNHLKMISVLSGHQLMIKFVDKSFHLSPMTPQNPSFEWITKILQLELFTSNFHRQLSLRQLPGICFRLNYHFIRNKKRAWNTHENVYSYQDWWIYTIFSILLFARVSFPFFRFSFCLHPAI